MPPSAPVLPRGWLRGAPFDLTLVLGAALLALAAGGVAHASPTLFMELLGINLWLLGYHHVVATYTRLAFDLESFREHRFLVLGLPWLVLGGVALLWWGVGLWAVSTLYFYWQWFHYTRQSYGVYRVYARKAGEGLAAEAGWDTALLYAVPLWGILHRSHAMGRRELFLAMKVRFVPVPGWLVGLAGVVALGLVLRFLVTRARARAAGTLVLAPALYMVSHLVVFTVGYAVLPDLDHGWLVLNVWHNAQYLLVVWMYNRNRFREGVDPEHRALSWLSQGTGLHVLAYFGVCLVVTTGFYAVVGVGVQAVMPGTENLGVVLAYQAINFHHYIVDGLIWKVRKASVRQRLGVAG